MHILYLHQYFATPRGATGTRSYEFARRWVAAGHRVTMVTTVAQLTPADLPAGPPRRVTRFTVDGINVIALNVRYHQTMGFTRRVWAFVRFMLRSTWIVLRQPDVDVVYATSTPLTVGIPPIVARRLRGRRFVFEVRDPWPAVPIALGAIRNRIAIRLCRRLERTVYRSAEAIVTLSPGMTELARAVAPAGKRIETIPNCADTDLFLPGTDGSGVREKYGWGDRLVCAHIGTIGLANGVDIIVRAAHRFIGERSLLFVLIGEGGEKEAAVAQRDRLGLSNLQFLDPVPKKDLPAVFAAVDIGLVTFARVPVLEHNSANKLFDYLSAGKPVVLNYAGWQRQVLEEAGAGVGCEMGDEEAFFENLSTLSADPAGRAVMGQAARRLAVERFDRSRLAAKALAVIVESVERAR